MRARTRAEPEARELLYDTKWHSTTIQRLRFPLGVPCRVYKRSWRMLTGSSSFQALSHAESTNAQKRASA